MNFQTESITDVAMKATLPVGVTSMNLFGISLPDWVQILTAIYVFLLGVDKIYLMFLRYREARNKELHEIKDES
jgi:hypothetical protein